MSRIVLTSSYILGKNKAPMICMERESTNSRSEPQSSFVDFIPYYLADYSCTALLLDCAWVVLWCWSSRNNERIVICTSYQIMVQKIRVVVELRDPPTPGSPPYPFNVCPSKNAWQNQTEPPPSLHTLKGRISDLRCKIASPALESGENDWLDKTGSSHMTTQNLNRQLLHIIIQLLTSRSRLLVSLAYSSFLYFILIKRMPYSAGMLPTNHNLRGIWHTNYAM